VTRRVLASRTVLLLVPLIVCWSLDLSAQSSVTVVEPHRALSPESEPPVEPRDWLVAPGRLESDAVRQDGTRPFALVVIRSSEITTGRIAGPRATLAGGGERMADPEVPPLILSAAVADSAFLAVQQPGPRKRSWIGRHPVLFGSIVGFSGGDALGYLVVKHDGFGYGVDAVEMGFLFGLTGGAVGALVGALAGP
jgi:hypothetical protein